MAKSDLAAHRVAAQNRKARHAYEIEDSIEAGIVLLGSEVKSLREGRANIAESYAKAEGNEVWLVNAHIPEYKQAGQFNHEPRRPRKLLLKKREAAGPPPQHCFEGAGEIARQGPAVDAYDTLRPEPSL